MRRIVWLLAVCGVVGAAVPWSLAAERFGVAKTGAASTASKDRVSVPGKTESTPQVGLSGTPVSPGPAGNRRQNYSQLFGDDTTASSERGLPRSGSLLDTVSADRIQHPLGEASTSAPGHPLEHADSLPARKPLAELRRDLPVEKPTANPKSTGVDPFAAYNSRPESTTGRPESVDAKASVDAAPATGVVKAGFDKEETPFSKNEIQQVRGDGFSARPFPGQEKSESVAAPASRRGDAFSDTFGGLPAQGIDPANDFTPSPSRDRFGGIDEFRSQQSPPASNNRLTDPISISSGLPGTDDPLWDLEDKFEPSNPAGPRIANPTAATPSPSAEQPVRPRGGLTFGNAADAGRLNVISPSAPRGGVIPRPGQPIPPATPHPGAAALNRGPSRVDAAFGLSGQAGQTRTGNAPPVSDPNVLGNGVTTVQDDIVNAKQSPTVTLEWRKSGALNVGQQCECELIIRNTGLIAAEDIEVAAFFPRSARLVSATPEPDTAQTYLGWQFASLQPGAEETIHINLIPTERGELETTAEIRFTGAASTNFTVAEPMLTVHVAGPEQVMIGEPASHTITVSNPGTGVATNVVIEALIPKGLEHARGNRLIMELGSLNPSETRTMRLALAAVDGGNHVIQVQAKADSGIAETDVAEVDVIAPSLVAEIDGPGLRYLGRTATYVLRVRNDGAIATDNVRLMHKIPDGFELSKSDRGTQYDKANRLLNWFVGRLNPGQTSEIQLTFEAQKLGDFTHFVRVTSEHGAISDAQINTSVEGSPSLVMEVRDIDDPVEVGVETAYEIRVKNEGSAPARNVAVGCELPPGMTLIKATGPVDAFNDQSQVIYRPVAELAPGNSITYRVLIRGVENGHHRFRAQLSSDSIPEPLTKDELTRFYGK
ncbi:MAG: hypothetical protein R3C01_08780 [Planctomycetaceae bacterium]